MKQIHHIALWLAIYVVSAFLASCGKDFQDDIDKLNSKHTSIEQRVTTLETQVTGLNTQISQLSVLATAVEQNFYITQVNTTDDGYELTLSNGRKIVLQKMPDGTITSMPAISMVQMNGLFYWTINGQLYTDSDGKPIRSTERVPVVKYDFTLQQWFISIDGGVTFQNTNTYISVLINDQVLMQVINSYISQHTTTIFSKQMLYQVISTYIQQNYKQLFDIRILDEVVVNYVDEHYTRLFSYELLEKIFKQYNFEYITTNIRVDELVNVIINFIKEHNEIFENNEVLYEIISSYIELNKTTIFSEELLLEVINNFIANNQNYIDVELLTQIVTNYIDVHRDVVFNTETVKTLHMEYLKKYYVQVFSQSILIQALNTYVMQNKTTIFNETLIQEIINNYVKNNYTTIFKQDVFVEIINNYMRLNGSTVFNHDVLVEVVTNYFSKNYNLIIDQTVISKAVNDYIIKHKDTIISVEVIEQIIYNYLEQNYKTVFSVDIISQLIVNYFDQNTEVIKQYVGSAVDIIQNIIVDNELCNITLRNGQTVQLVVYDAMTRLRDRVQSIVVMPDNEGYISYTGSTANIEYYISPNYAANYIVDLFKKREITMELKVTDGNYMVSSVPISETPVSTYNTLQVSVKNIPLSAKAAALYIKEKKKGGSDIMTEFTLIRQVKDEPEKPKAYKQCPDDHHPHMIDLGLPSGTLWSCCNVGAYTPEAIGNYFAWGEVETKLIFEANTYKHIKISNIWSFIHIGNDIAGTQYDVAKVKWGNSWHMPNRIQCQELVDKCSCKEVNSKNSYCLLTGPNGGSIKLPIGSCKYGDNIGYNKDACYWTSTLSDERDQWSAYGMDWYQNNGIVDGTYDNKFRYIGRLVRPVAAP